MANPNPVKKFKKGSIEASIAGKKSSRALPPDLKEARQIRAIEFESIIYKYMDHSPLEIKKLLDDNNEIIDGKKVSKLPAKELIVLKLVHKAMEDGDLARLNFLLNRTIGAIPEKIQLDANVKSEVKTLHEQIVEALKNDNSK